MGSGPTYGERQLGRRNSSHVKIWLEFMLKRVSTKIVILVGAILSNSSFVVAQTAADRQICVLATAVAAETNTTIGEAIDDVTTDEGMIVNCAFRVVTFQARIAVKITDIRPAALSARAANWNQLVCGDELGSRAVKANWAWISLQIFSDERTHRVVAVCN
jgi:hypothetical protein